MIGTESEKPLVNVVFMGHVNHGKSTLIGRLLYELGQIDERFVERLKREADIVKSTETGKSMKSFFWAYVMDFSKKEREMGHTIEVSFWKPLETKTNRVKILDVPGHRLWLSNMVSGATQADSAIFVIDVSDIVDKDITKLMELREHLTSALILGIKQIVVTLNKMDIVGYRRETYEQVREQIIQYMKILGYTKPEDFVFIPISAFHGENITKRSEKMEWFDGPTVISAIEAFKEPPRPIDKPLRLPIFRHYDTGNVAVGTIETGSLLVGDTVVVKPADVTGVVQSIEAWGERTEKAKAGDDIGLRIRGVARYNLKRGFVIGHLDNPPQVAKIFTARIHVTNPKGIWAGYSPVIHCHTSQVAGQIEKILRKIDPDTGKTIRENPDYLSQNEMGDVLIRPLSPKMKGLVIEKYKEFPALGRFALRDQKTTIAAGICTDIEPY